MINYQVVEELKDIQGLWNNEMGNIYPLADNVFSCNVCNYKEKFVYGAYDETKMVGFVITKKFTNDILPDYHKKGWISLFYVAKASRRQGIGSRLLSEAENYLSDKKEILIGQDIGNFFPGLPADFNNLTDLWLSKKGYSLNRTTHDLINYKPQNYPIKNTHYTFRTANRGDISALEELFKTFSPRWTYEGKSYFAAGGTGEEYVICCDKEKIIAFSRLNDSRNLQGGYNITWYPRFSCLGGIGPLGVHPAYRKQGIGYDIVAYAINEAKKRGLKEIIIDWTGLLEFYQRFDFEVWKAYKYISKKA